MVEGDQGSFLPAYMPIAERHMDTPTMTPSELGSFSGVDVMLNLISSMTVGPFLASRPTVGLGVDVAVACAMGLCSRA